MQGCDCLLSHLPPQGPQNEAGIIAIISASDEMPSTTTGRGRVKPQGIL